MGQWIIILALALIGQFVSDLISFPIPKTIIASIILFLLLEFKVLKVEYFKGVLAGCKIFSFPFPSCWCWNYDTIKFCTSYGLCKSITYYDN